MLNFQFLTGFYPPIYQQFQVFPSRGDMIRYGCTIMSVMFTNEPFLLPKSHLGKPWIVYYDLLQSYQFCFCDRPLHKIGRAHVRLQVTNAHLVCRLMLEKTNTLLHIPTLKRTIILI